MRRPNALLAVTLAAVIGAITLTAAAPARAAGIEVRAQSVQNRFPDGLQFSIFVASDANISEVRLRYSTAPENIPNFVRPMCQEGNVVNCSALVGNTSASYLVPGAAITYNWEVADAAGQRLETPAQTATYQDDRFRWESLTEGNVTAYVYSGTDDAIRTILRTANQTLIDMSRLLKTRVDFPVKVWVYNNARELQPALAGQRSTGTVTHGQVAAPDTALLSRDLAALSTVRHEVAHIVTRKATRTHVGGVPTWINEGLSTYAQGRLDEGQQSALDSAVRRNRPIPIESLSGSSGGPDVNLFYGQSGAMIRFMIETYGETKFGDFFTALASNTMEGALRAVYGFDQLGLENEWRKSVGLPTVSATGGQSGGQPGTLPTIVPFGAQGQGAVSTPERPSTGPQTQSGDSDEGGGSSNGLVIAIVALTAVLVAVLLGAGVYLARKAS